MPKMDTAYLRGEFLQVKGFLYDLYTNNPRANSSKLTFANAKCLNTLIKVLHLICNGDITIRKVDHTALVKSRRFKTLRTHFENKKDYLQMLNASSEEKIKTLKFFVALYKNLLYTMFNEI